MTTWICTRTNELQHHGIKGQKWGIRRFQNKDGSLTPAGRRRYDDDEGPRQSTGKSSSSNLKVGKSSGSTTKETKKHRVPKNKSLHRLQLEEKYRKQGMSQEEAEQAAAK